EGPDRGGRSQGGVSGQLDPRERPGFRGAFILRISLIVIRVGGCRRRTSRRQDRTRRLVGFGVFGCALRRRCAGDRLGGPRLGRDHLRPWPRQRRPGRGGGGGGGAPRGRRRARPPPPPRRPVPAPPRPHAPPPP